MSVSSRLWRTSPTRPWAIVVARTLCAMDFAAAAELTFLYPRDFRTQKGGVVFYGSFGEQSRQNDLDVENWRLVCRIIKIIFDPLFCRAEMTRTCAI